MKMYAAFALVLGFFITMSAAPASAQKASPEEVKICNSYKDQAGNILKSLPDEIEVFDEIEPIYESMPGWSESTVGAKTVEELPQAARNYIKRLEKLVGVSIDIISTGPDREETIVLTHPFE